MTPPLNRREVLAATASALVIEPGLARGAVIKGGLPWRPGAANPPPQATPGPWRYFTPAEAAAVEALVDRLIPPDPQTPGGRDAGCAVFIDRQLAGAYGSLTGLYMQGPFRDGTKEQGPQSPVTPAEHYRKALAALDRHCRSTFAGVGFAELPDATKDELIKSLEDDKLKFEDIDGKSFFDLILSDALDLKPDVFALKDPKRIAASLKRSAEAALRPPDAHVRLR
jgi:gluconate 2-dehydrogenase gamma chain